MTNKNAARDFFLYLFATGLVYFLAVNLITLLWQYINYFFPAPYEYGGDVSSGMIFAVSSLLVLFPIYAFVMRFLGREIDKHPEKREFGPRKWLIYITLFVASITAVVDLVVLVNTFLSGDFAARFVLKALVVLVVAGLLFWYYLFNLRRAPGESVRARKNLFAGSLVLLLALIIGAFFIAGGPESNREENYDRQRVADLSSIQWQVVNYWQDHSALPENLEVFNDPILQTAMPIDPESGEAYVYEKTGELGFMLCANFSSASKEDDLSREKFYGEDASYWQHEAGEQCFERTLDPELHGRGEANNMRGPVPGNF